MGHWPFVPKINPWPVLDFLVPVARIDGHLGNGSQSNIASLESPSADMHRWLRPDRRNTAVSRSILGHVGHSQRETEIRGECIDNHAGDDSDEAFLSIKQ